MIVPSIWNNRKFIRLNYFEKILFIGLFSTADDYGKLWYDLLSFKASIFPCDNITVDDLKNAIDVLSENKLILTDFNVIQIHGWKNHQAVPKPQSSTIPNIKISNTGLFYNISEEDIIVKSDNLKYINNNSKLSEKKKLTEKIKHLLNDNSKLFEKSNDKLNKITTLLNNGENLKVLDLFSGIVPDDVIDSYLL